MKLRRCLVQVRRIPCFTPSLILILIDVVKMGLKDLQVFFATQENEFGMWIQNPQNKIKNDVSYDDMKEALNKYHIRMMKLAAKFYSTDSSPPVTPKRKSRPIDSPKTPSDQKSINHQNISTPRTCSPSISRSIRVDRRTNETSRESTVSSPAKSSPTRSYGIPQTPVGRGSSQRSLRNIVSVPAEHSAGGSLAAAATDWNNASSSNSPKQPPKRATQTLDNCKNEILQAVVHSPSYKGPPLTEQYSPSKARWDGNKIVTHDQLIPRRGYKKPLDFDALWDKLELDKARKNQK